MPCRKNDVKTNGMCFFFKFIHYYGVFFLKVYDIPGDYMFVLRDYTTRELYI